MLNLVEIGGDCSSLFSFKEKIEVPDPSTEQWLAKSNNGGVSTMFPRSWDAERIKTEVEHAFANRKIEIEIQHGKPVQTWKGVTPSGVKVKGYLEPNITVYPLMK